jgi:GxxExxY protein
MTEILYKDESYNIIGACMEVHKNLGPGFLESVYCEALILELKKRNIPFEHEKKLMIYYEGKPLKKYFRADFVCFEKIILEIKSNSFLTENDKKQSYNYLKATQFKLGLLLCFGNSSLIYKRIVN